MLIEITNSVLAALRNHAAEWLPSLLDHERSQFGTALVQLRDARSDLEAAAAARKILAFVAEPRGRVKMRQVVREQTGLTNNQVRTAANEAPSAQGATREQVTLLRRSSDRMLAELPATATAEHNLFEYSESRTSGHPLPFGVHIRKANPCADEPETLGLSPGGFEALSIDSPEEPDSLPVVRAGSVRPAREGVRSQAFEAPGGETPVAQPEPAAPAPRFLIGRLSNEVQVGQRVPLQARIGLTPSGGTSAVLRPFLVTPGTQVMLDVYSPGFVIRSDATQTITVPADRDSDWARFELEARTPGNQTVEVNAWNNGAFLGTLSLDVTVTTAAAQGQPTEKTGGMGMRDAGAGEVTLDVQYDLDKKQYRYQLRGEVIGVLEPFFSKTFPEGRDGQFTQLITQMNQQAKALQQYSPDAARDWLIGVGTQLWDDLIPLPLKEAFWQNLDKIARLNIVSSADPLPWEMVCPFQDGHPETAQFLADRFSVSRWTYGPPPCETLNIADPYFVLPPDAPASAPVEVQALRGILGYAGTVAHLDELTKLIKGRQFGLLHFATHNVQHDGGLTDSYIPLDGQRFSQAFLGPVYRRTLNERSPLIFMNACTSAGASPTYTGMTSWANCFLNAGAGAFIGSLWEVRDGAAQEFSEAFYSTLKGGATLADAMHAGRAAISEQADDPTWLAYTLYGDPSARLA